MACGSFRNRWRLKKILIVFVFLILAELYLLILFGQTTHPAFAIGYIAVTVFSGYLLVLGHIRFFTNHLYIKLKHHELKFLVLIDWLTALLGAVLILIPGILSDVLGILLSLGISRRRILKSLWPLIKDSAFITLLKIRLKEELDKRGLQDFIP